jgi:hypothetical protein
MGAAAVLATAAETPPMRKSVMKALASLGFLTTSAMVVTAKSVWIQVSLDKGVKGISFSVTPGRTDLSRRTKRLGKGEVHREQIGLETDLFRINQREREREWGMKKEKGVDEVLKRSFGGEGRRGAGGGEHGAPVCKMRSGSGLNRRWRAHNPTASISPHIAGACGTPPYRQESLHEPQSCMRLYALPDHLCRNKEHDTQSQARRLY